MTLIPLKEKYKVVRPGRFGSYTGRTGSSNRTRGQSSRLNLLLAPKIKFVKAAGMWCLTYFESGIQQRWFSTKEQARESIQRLEKLKGKV